MKSSTDSSKTRIDTFLTNHKQILLLMIFALAMLRVLFFSAAFPFFNNVDEQAHFDTVVKYSKGKLPHKNTINYEYESAELIVLYGSPEYFKSSGDFKSAKIPPPLWHLNREQLSPYINTQISNLTGEKNHEAFSPPVYYILAGAWYDLAKLFGISGGYLLYWIRFLNVPVYAALFWFAYFFCKYLYKNDLFMQLGILLLLSFFPQDTYYSISNDTLSPLFCVMSLYLLFHIYGKDKSLLFHVFTGIVVSATFLTKFSNFPMLIIFTIIILFRIRKLLNARRLKEQLPRLLFLVIGCLFPIGLWLGRNAYIIGDITGSVEKARNLGWTVKPFTEITNHPFFHLDGLTYFVSELLRTFWRGEFVWGLQNLASNEMDFFYVISSCILVLISVINSLISKDDYRQNQRFINCINSLFLLFSFFFLAILSTIYDFGECWYPSRELPFFTSGRLILGALVPFFILYLDGLRIIVSKINGRINPFLIVLVIGILIAYSEIKISYAVIGSKYNLFHILYH